MLLSVRKLRTGNIVYLSNLLLVNVVYLLVWQTLSIILHPTILMTSWRTGPGEIYITNTRLKIQVMNENDNWGHLTSQLPISHFVNILNILTTLKNAKDRWKQHCTCILELCPTWSAVTPPTLLELCSAWPAVTPSVACLLGSKSTPVLCR